MTLTVKDTYFGYQVCVGKVGNTDGSGTRSMWKSLSFSLLWEKLGHFIPYRVTKSVLAQKCDPYKMSISF